MALPYDRDDRVIAQDYWKTYQQFGFDARAGMQQKESMTKARMAAGGGTAGSQRWTQQLSNIQTDYEKEIEDIKGGATSKVLDKWVDQQKGLITDINRSKYDTRVYEDDGQDYQSERSEDARKSSKWYGEELDSRLRYFDLSTEKPEFDETRQSDEDFERQMDTYKTQKMNVAREFNKEVMAMGTNEFLEKDFGIYTPEEEQSPDEISAARTQTGGARQGSAAQGPDRSPWW